MRNKNEEVDARLWYCIRFYRQMNFTARGSLLYFETSV